MAKQIIWQYGWTFHAPLLGPTGKQLWWRDMEEDTAVILELAFCQGQTNVEIGQFTFDFQDPPP